MAAERELLFSYPRCKCGAPVCETHGCQDQAITEADIEAFCLENDRVRPDPNDQKAVNSFVSWLMAWKYEKDGLTW